MLVKLTGQDGVKIKDWSTMKTKIIYEDDHILVCYKPAGLATQTSKVGQQDMVSELKNYLMGKQRAKEPCAGSQRVGDQRASAPYLGVVHRLDQPVEGLLVFAKNSKVAAGLTAQLSQGTLNKQYYAVVCGQPVDKSGELADYMWKDSVSGSAMVVNDRMAGARDLTKKAVLQYRVIGQLSTQKPVTLLDIHIDTGRFHQIRAQLSHADLPILGDSRYGSEQSKVLSQRMGVRNVALCAYRIVLQHPVTHKRLEFQEKPQGAIFSKF